MSEPKDDQIEFGNHNETPKPVWPWAGLLLVVLVSLLMPALLLISVRTIPPAVWALWAMLSLWVVLDSGRLVRTVRFGRGGRHIICSGTPKYNKCPRGSVHSVASMNCFFLWAALDIPRLSKVFGRSTDPLAPETMGLAIGKLPNKKGADEWRH